jgi:hypothetical protein
MKKTTKEHPITFFRKANEARQAVVKKSMKKAQDGGTPFQSYMKTPGATAADTSATNMSYAIQKTKDKPLLTKAYELTYGQDYGNSSTGNPFNKEQFQDRRGDHSGYKDMSNPMRKAYEAQVSKYTQKKKGGSVKRKK